MKIFKIRLQLKDAASDFFIKDKDTGKYLAIHAYQLGQYLTQEVP